MNGTQALIPDMRPEARDVTVPLSELPEDSALVSPAPSAALVRSVAALGIQQPIILVGESGSWEVAAGRRRIKAARAAGLSEIPARVYKRGDVSPSVIALIENEQRSRNLKNDFAAVEDLRSKGYSDEEVMSAVGIDKGRYRALLRVGGLSAGLREAWLDGSIQDSAAMAASHLTPNQQGRLEETYEENGKLKLADVKAAKRALVGAAVNSLDPSLFGRPRQEVTVDNPLARFSDDEIMAEIARRGLTLS